MLLLGAIFVLSSGCAKKREDFSCKSLNFVSSTSSTGWTNVCQKVTGNVVGLTGISCNTPDRLGIGVQTTSGTIYSDTACASASSNFEVPAGGSTAFFFLKAAAGPATVTVSPYAFSTQNVSVTVGAPTAGTVLGQALFTTTAANNGGLGGGTLSSPGGVFRYGNKLFVADSTNNRVLIWNSIPSSSSTNPDVVLGQPNLVSNTANNGGVSAYSLSDPAGIYTDGTKLYVADRGNNRILIWNAIPTASHIAANVVLGQPDMFSNTANNGGIAANTLSTPESVWISNSRLYVADGGNNRVLIWFTVPTTTSKVADLVLGQTDMLSNGAGTTGTGLSHPRFAKLLNSKLFVSDTGNNRVLVWTSQPILNGTTAAYALGQPNLTTVTANTGGVGASTLNAPGEMDEDALGRFFVADYSNFRVLIWNTVPTTSGAAADAVMGQANLTSNTVYAGGVASASDFGGPKFIYVFGTEFWLSDVDANRVLRFTLP